MNRQTIIIISIISAAILVVAGIFLYRNMQGRKSTQPLQEIIQAQTQGVLSASGMEAREKLIASVGGESKALVITNDFEIGYLSPPGERLMVFIFSDTPEAAEANAINWIKSRGFSESDICNFPTIISGVGANRLPAFCNGAI